MTDTEWTPSASGDRSPSGAATAALVGSAGGVGTTRLTVETGAVLARAGHRVAAFDAALATQGMVDYVDGRVDPDVTDLMTDESTTPAGAMTELGVADGEFHLCPARAPFGDLARAKTPEAGQRLATAIREATDAFEFVLVDVPPVATNPAVSAVTAVDRVGVVAPPTDRGSDAVQRIRGRLDDVGSGADLVVGNRGDPDGLGTDGVVPEGPTGVDAAPTDDDEFAAAVASLAERLFEVDLDLGVEPDGLLERIP